MSKNSTPSVNLFPFLAVLVCTMGALILLLLVTTRRIRQQAQLPTPLPVVDVVEEAVSKSFAQLDPADEPVLPWMAFDPPRVEPVQPFVDWKAEREQRKLEYEQARLERERKQQTLNAEWADKLAKVMRQTQMLTSQLQQAKEVVSGTQAEVEDAQAEVNRLTSILAKAMTEKASMLNEMEQRKLGQKKIEAEFFALQSQLEDVQQHAQEKEVEFEIVGFNGTSKTRRRPILIECRDDGITFAVEGVTLTPDQLTGFTAAHNPLKAGGEALADYWTRTEHLEETNTKPYILLLVRPGGTVAFYVARQMFEKMDDEFGYELIPHNKPLRWADPDPQAVIACKTAVEAVLEERAQLAARLRSGRLPIAGSLMFEGPDGKFHLQEVDQLRNAGDDFGTGAEKWRPPHKQQTRTYGNIDTSQDTPGGLPGQGYNREPISADSLETGSALRSLEDILEEQRALQQGVSSLGQQNSEEDSGPGAFPPRTRLQPATSSTQDVFGQSALNPEAQQSQSGHQGARSPSGQPQLGRTQSGQPSQTGQGMQPQQGGGGSNSGGQRSSSSGKPVEQRMEDWVPRDPRANIGIEREIKIHIRKESVQIDDLPPLKLSTALTPDELRTQFEMYLRSYFNSWEAAPQSFFWRPYLRYEIHPGGNLPYARLKPITDAWKAKTKTDYVLD